MAAAGLADLFARDAGGRSGAIQISVHRFEGERQFLFALGKHNMLGLRKVSAQRLLVAAVVPTAPLAPDDMVQQVEMLAGGQFHLGGQVKACSDPAGFSAR
ncbi:hypothetical protein [Methylobacter sp.]|uniref:hypothetical protein n=1 Tax=Methylobacter sp. TaxID=2051955 RepID=UPI003DA27073